MKYTEKAAVSIISKMLRSLKNEPRESLRYTWIDGAGRQCSCDGFRAYRLNKPVAGLPDMPANLRAIDLDRIFPDARNMYEITLPAFEDVKALCTADRANKDEPQRYQFPMGEGLPVVNLLYLRDMMQMFPGARCYVTGLYNPILFVSEHGDGVLLPLRNARTTPRQIPGRDNAPRVPVYSAAQFAARYAA